MKRAIEWARIPRQGFIASHWVGKTESGREFSIWMSPRSKYRRAVAFGLRPDGGIYPTLKEAKDYAEFLAWRGAP